VVKAKAVYLAIDIAMTCQKEVLGLWIAQTEGGEVLATSGYRAQESGRTRYLHHLC